MELLPNFGDLNVTVQCATHITDHHPMLYNRIFLSHDYPDLVSFIFIIFL